MKQKHIIAFSGGKDSAAMLFKMIELKMPIDLVLFCDTGKEFPQLYEYVNKVKSHITGLGIEFRTLTPAKTWDDWFYGEITRGKMKGQKRGWPLMLFHCYWSREAKFKLMDPICQGNQRYIGFASDEIKRVKAGSKKDGYNFPLADWDWTEKMALDYLKSIGWAEEFHLDFNRTGCFLCPKQPRQSLETLCRKYPDQWKELMRYAKDAPNNFKPGMSYNDLLEIERLNRA